MRLEIKAMKKATQIVPIQKPIQKQSKIFNSVKIKKVLAHSNATKILETATVALDKHKEEIEVKHKNSSARLQKRLTKRMSNKNPIGMKVVK